MAIDFQAALDSFSQSSMQGSDPIASIYNILPTYSPKQQRMLVVMRYFIARWDLDDIQEALEQMQKTISTNKNLGLLQQKSLESLLSAYTQNEMIRGIKVQSFNDNTTKSD